MIRSYLQKRLESRTKVFKFDDLDYSLRNTTWKISRVSAFVRSFAKSFIFIRGPQLKKQKDKRTFVFSKGPEMIYKQYFFDSTAIRGSPQVGCIRYKELGDADFSRPFSVRNFNYSQQLHFGLRGINVNKGSPLKDVLGVPCGKFDIGVQNCHGSGVSKEDDVNLKCSRLGDSYAALASSIATKIRSRILLSIRPSLVGF